MPTLTLPDARAPKNEFQSDVEFVEAAISPSETTPPPVLALEYAITIWSEAKPIAQLAEEFFR